MPLNFSTNSGTLFYGSPYYFVISIIISLLLATNFVISSVADFENGNLIQKVKNMVPLLVPLFISAFRRANDLAMAMEARCYHGGDNRTQMKPLKYKKRDHIAYLILFAYLAVAIGFRVAGL